jgi:3-keto-disaccharide hydrolase
MAGGLAFAADNPFLGSWELTIPGGAAGWLGVSEADGHLAASMLWGWGSVEPTASARLEDGKLVVIRDHEFETKDASGKRVRKTYVEQITATTDGDTIQLVSIQPRQNGAGVLKQEFSGKRTPPMPPAPDLSQVKYGDPIQLFNGTDLTGWRLTDPNAVNGWSVQDGLLVNNPVQEKGQRHKNYGNLRTDGEFTDFNLTLEVRPEKGENSGVYLRGMYEVQVEDSYGKPLDSHNMGAIYSRIKPTANAEKPPGEWQTMDITFVDRHVTVILNGVRIIDNQPVEGCTGGALWSDVSRPGPIYLQGDHTGIAYRNIVLRPVEH